MMAEDHDPGGKLRWPLPPGVQGSAHFSQCGRYRHSLRRWWGHDDSPYVLVIGQNPSTAEANVDDPTIRREMAFTRAWMIDVYVKCNVMDYRATFPAMLRAPGVTPCSGANRETIRSLAPGAQRIILCYGKLHKTLRHHADNVVRDLAGYDLWCLGRNGDGSPKHPLYLAGDTPIELFRAARPER